MNRREMMAGAVSSMLLVAGSDVLKAQAVRSPLKGYIRTNWSRDPFAFGSYSYLAKGSGNADRAILAAPISDRVFFAGEALNPNYQVSVHAAHESGVAEASTLLGTLHRRIAIIGAGMAGLSAAHRLAEAGREVTVYEARDRIGGRIWTDHSLGVPLDLGASWIHGPIDNPLTALADEAGLARVETDEEYAIRGENGKEIWSMFAPGWLEQAAVELSMAATYDELNGAETQAQYEKYGVGYEGRDVIFPRGYDEIFTALESHYAVRLATKVTEIGHTGTGVTIGTEDGGAERFDAVMVTVPLGVLKQGVIAFVPALSPEKSAAVDRMGMGTLDKLYLLFERRFWDKDATIIMTPHNGLPQGHFNHWINFEKYLDVPVLLAFNYGPYARTLSTDTDEAFLAKALGTLAKAYPV